MKRVVAGLIALAVPAVAQQWKSQYFYDENKTSLEIYDLAFPSAQRGVAVGAILKGTHRQAAAVITSDGGMHWELTRPEELPVSAIFPRGLIKTAEYRGNTDRSSCCADNSCAATGAFPA